MNDDLLKDLDSIIQKSLNRLSEKTGIDLTPPTLRPPRNERELRDAIQMLKDYNSYVLYPLIEAQARRMVVSQTSTYLIEINDSNREWIEDQLRKQ